LLAGCQQSGRPSAKPAALPPPAFGQIVEESYIVAPGDTVAVVSKRTNTPIRTLIDLNGLQPPYRLRGGEKLVLQPRGDYVVAPGDTIETIAQRQGVSPSALIQLNGLTAPYAVAPGQRLVLPSERDVPSEPPISGAQASEVQSTGALAPLPSAVAPASGAPTTLATAPAEPIEPAGSSAKAIEPSATQPAATEPTAIEPTVPSPSSDGVSESALPPLQPQSSQSVEPAPQPPAVPEPPAAIVPDASPAAEPSAASPAEVAALPEGASESGFIWPVDGKVVSRFGTTSDGLRNDGINIAAPEGAPVKAAADGVVAYAGNELRGFGNMILIKHADNWVTAYAHNSSLLVKKGDKVRQGQVIARVGSSGNVANSQLHFEIRNGTKAVDPIAKLGG
jgi:murein DD-endopeptidase MepM/ murein hydrolase activator NlpD